MGEVFVFRGRDGREEILKNIQGQPPGKATDFKFFQPPVVYTEPLDLPLRINMMTKLIIVLTEEKCCDWQMLYPNLFYCLPHPTPPIDPNNFN